MRKITAALCALLIMLLAASCGKPPAPEPDVGVPPEPPATAAPEPLPVYTPVPSAEPEPESEPSEPPEQTDFVLTFAGDCTLAAEHDYRTAEWSFGAVMGDDYAYPFEFASELMLDDDFTMVNLECALTDYNVPADKLFCFRGDPSYTGVLTLGGVDCVSIANNHSGDYGETGVADTKAALDAAGIAWASDGGTCMFTTGGGLKIGVCAAFYRFDRLAYMIGALREAGADIVIVACHYGEEGSYRYDSNQEIYSKRAIDYGADIVFGTHPHVLQKIESYGGGVIYYSLGNFVFGGNSNPRDKDTAVIRQHVIRENGTYRLGETEIVPFALSGSSSYNDYRPVPCEEGSEQYLRILSKLDGTFDGPNLYVSYNQPSPEPEDTPPEPEDAPSEGEEAGGSDEESGGAPEQTAEPAVEQPQVSGQPSEPAAAETEHEETPSD